MPTPFVGFPSRVKGQTADTRGVHGPQQTDIRAHLSGQVDPHDPEIDALIVVNPREYGITGWGDDNNQQFQSGWTNNLHINQSAEQGWGVGPERKWAHYPTVEQPNPYRALNVLRRMGGDGYSDMIYRPETTAYWASAMGHELSQAQVKHRASGYPTVNQAPSVPYVSTIPPVNPGGY